MKSIVISNHEQIMPTGPKTASTGNLRGKPAATCAAMRPNGTWGERGNLLFKRLAFVIAAAKYQPCPVGYVRKRWFVGLAPNNGHKEGWGCNLFSTYEYRRLGFNVTLCITAMAIIPNSSRRHCIAGRLFYKNISFLFYRLRKDLAAFLGLELPSLLPPSVEEEKKERRKNLASYLGVEENVLSTVLPPPPPPSTLRHRPGKAHLPLRDLHPHAPSKATPPECHLNYSPLPQPAHQPDHQLDHQPDHQAQVLEFQELPLEEDESEEQNGTVLGGIMEKKKNTEEGRRDGRIQMKKDIDSKPKQEEPSLLAILRF